MTLQIHGVNTRRNFHLYRPQSNLTTYQRGPLYFGIKLFNNLPLNIKESAYNIKQFKCLLTFQILLHLRGIFQPGIAPWIVMNTLSYFTLLSSIYILIYCTMFCICFVNVM
jgi:hypothetical protein